MAIKTGVGPGTRRATGDAILAAARAVDTHLIKARLAAFERAHRAYTAAQGKVEAEDGQLRAGQARVAEFDVAQDEAVENLARMLVADGQPRANPFASFGAPAPSTLIKMPVIEEGKAIHKLVAAVQRNKTVSKATLQAAQAADKAAKAVEQALVPIEKLQTALKTARHTRDAVGQSWETALAALKRGARAAGDDGAPQLYATLFKGIAQPSPRNNKPKPPPPQPTPPQPAPVSA